MDVLGKSADNTAYRIAVDVGGRDVEALVSDALLSSEYGRSGRVGHQEAYEWIASNRHAITEAVGLLTAGRTPRAPFDGLALVKES